MEKNLLEEDFRNYYSAVVTILSPEGKLLGESGNSVDLGTLTDKNIWILIENAGNSYLFCDGHVLR